MVDFAEAGELSVFIDEEQLSAVEERMNAKGYLRRPRNGHHLQHASRQRFDLVVRQQLPARQIAFSVRPIVLERRSTRMPAAMHSFYLRNMYQENLLVKPGGLALDRVPIDLRKIQTPSFWRRRARTTSRRGDQTYSATQIYRGPVKFVLSASGHIAGVVNPPGGKYGHWENDKNLPNPEGWLATATAHADSWWPLWEFWISQYAGAEVPARHPGDGKLKPIEDAPGSYVKVRAAD
jgi:polyhydroxyalkanoate synthase